MATGVRKRYDFQRGDLGAILGQASRDSIAEAGFVTVASTTTAALQYWLGNEFTVASNITVSAVRGLANSTWHGQTLTVAFWDVATQTKVWEQTVTTSVDGWQDLATGLAVALTGGKTYRLGIHFPTTTPNGQYYDLATNTFVEGQSVDTLGRFSHDNHAVTAYPSGTTNTAAFYPYVFKYSIDGGESSGITFASAPDFATLGANEYIPLVITEGEIREIVHLTAYTAAATSGTVERAQEGTAQGSFTTAAKWVHGPTAKDLNDFGTMEWKGNWVAGTYSHGDLVSASGRAFVAINTPASSPLDPLALSSVGAVTGGTASPSGDQWRSSQGFRVSAAKEIRRLRMHMPDFVGQLRIGISTTVDPSTEGEWLGYRDGVVSADRDGSSYVTVEFDPPLSLATGTDYYVHQRSLTSANHAVTYWYNGATWSGSLVDHFGGAYYNGNQLWAGYYHHFELLEADPSGHWEEVGDYSVDGHTHADLAPSTHNHDTAYAALSSAMVVVNHGADASVARPTGVGAVYWIGSVQPTNALDSDLWHNTAA